MLTAVRALRPDLMTTSLFQIIGLRSFSMIWIILANTSILIANLGTDNGQALQDIYESFPQQFTLGSSLAVDTYGLITPAFRYPGP